MKSRKGKLILFVILTILISWGFWLPKVIDPSLGLAGVLSQFGVFGPVLAVLIMIPLYDAKGLFRRAIMWRFPKKYLIYSVLIGIGMPFLSYLIMIYYKGGAFELGLSLPMIPLVGLIILFVGGPVEEFGWRGFFLPRLLKETNVVFASLIVGLIHGVWHLPLHFMENTTQYHIPIYQFILVTTLSGFVYTWLYLNTEGSLVPALFYHWMGNWGGAVFMYWTDDFGRYVYFGMQLLFVLYVFIKDRKNLQRKVHAINIRLGR